MKPNEFKLFGEAPRVITDKIWEQASELWERWFKANHALTITKQKIIWETFLRNSEDEVNKDAGLLSLEEQEEFLSNVFAELDDVEDGRLQLLE